MTEPFTAVGIGDMSGDVFGNGMLCRPRCGSSPRSTTGTSSSIRDPDPAVVVRRAQAPVRHARVVVGRLRPHRLLSGGRRVFDRSAKSDRRRRPRRARPSAIPDDAPAEMPPTEVIRRGPAGAGRPPVERRDRYLREGVDGDERRRRRPDERPRAHQRRPGPRAGRRRGRQPRVHAARADRVRAARRPDQHRLHRQLGGGRLPPTTRST